MRVHWSLVDAVPTSSTAVVLEQWVVLVVVLVLQVEEGAPNRTRTA